MKQNGYQIVSEGLLSKVINHPFYGELEQARLTGNCVGKLRISNIQMSFYISKNDLDNTTIQKAFTLLPKVLPPIYKHYLNIVSKELTKENNEIFTFDKNKLDAEIALADPIFDLEFGYDDGEALFIYVVKLDITKNFKVISAEFVQDEKEELHFHEN